jgi:hypothetical protein
MYRLPIAIDRRYPGKGGDRHLAVRLRHALFGEGRDDGGDEEGLSGAGGARDEEAFAGEDPAYYSGLFAREGVDVGCRRRGLG